MVERIQLFIREGSEGLAGALVRYDILERVAATAERAGLTLLAFGFGEDELRLVVEGAPEAVPNMVRGLKVGTARAMRKWDLDVAWSPARRVGVEEGDELEAAVAWAHRAPVDGGASGPLASPWSSHRDLMGFRSAPFYEGRHLDGRVHPATVHRLAGGRCLPDGWPPARVERESLSMLLRVSAGVLGVLPADRRCFRLFVHLGRARGWDTVDLARALALTRRRIRQLAATDEPMLDVALQSLADPRLSLVP